MKKRFAWLMALAVLAFSIPSYAAENDIVEIASGNPDFSILVSALQEAELVSALQAEGPFTVFAPTNAAFADLLEALDIDAEALLSHPDLAKVLLYHVVSGKVMSTDLSDGMTAATLHGGSLAIGVDGGVTINDANVAVADIEASNGVIHVIDKVLVPEDFVLEQPAPQEEKPDIVEIALGDSQFSMLVMLLQKADLVSALQGEGPFTVFAPTNDAFNALLAELEISADELMAQPALADVLLYHVVSGKVMSTDLSDGLAAPTLEGDTVVFDLSSGVKVDSASVIAADVEASNGVIHVVDGVLIPEGFVLETIENEQEAIPKMGDVSAIPMLAALGAAAVGLAAARKRTK